MGSLQSCRFLTLFVLASSVVTLSACSSVSFRQLTPSLDAKSGSPSGAVYYLPKPYLFVAQLPRAAPTPTAAPDPTPPPDKKAKKGAGEVDGFPTDYFPVGGADGDKGEKGDGPAAPAMTGTSDASFGGISDGYIIKLVYLPDYSRPMSVSVKPGIGSATVKPTLQNGWMLTGFDASADSKVAEVLASVASVITAYKTPGKSADSKGGDGRPLDQRPVLRPGLYEFRYDTWGNLTGLCPVKFFGSEGVITPVPPSC